MFPAADLKQRSLQKWPASQPRVNIGPELKMSFSQPLKWSKRSLKLFLVCLDSWCVGCFPRCMVEPGRRCVMTFMKWMFLVTEWPQWMCYWAKEDKDVAREMFFWLKSGPGLTVWAERSVETRPPVWQIAASLNILWSCLPGNERWTSWSGGVRKPTSCRNTNFTFLKACLFMPVTSLHTHLFSAAYPPRFTPIVDIM